jgi:3-hydroxybutyryl-CoA dehydrogenase
MAVNNVEAWLKEVDKIAVIGGGSMGRGIALACALGGYDVTLQDIGGAILEKAMSLNASHMDTFISEGLATDKTKREVLARIRNTTDLAIAVSDAQIVFEAITDNLPLKQKLYKDMESISQKGTILAGNSGPLPASQVGVLCERKDAIIVAHWFNPPYIVPGVEVVPSLETSTETVARTCAFLEQIGKVPIKIDKEKDAIIGGRLMFAILNEAAALCEEGVSNAEDIDAVMRTTFGFRLPVQGLFERMMMAYADQVSNRSEEQRLASTEVFEKEWGPGRVRQVIKEMMVDYRIRIEGRDYYSYTRGGTHEEAVRGRDAKMLRILKALYPDNLRKMQLG